MIKFGRLTLVSKAIGRKWLFTCSCGTEKWINHSNVTTGRQVSCGCQKREVSAETGRKRATHGMKRTKEYKAWRSMRARCADPENPSYPNYGGRGITVCEAWLVIGGSGFLQFFADVGPAPTKAHSIDRIDNDGNYEPGNVKWSTAREQANNRRMTVFIETATRRTPLTEMAEEMGIGRVTLAQRLKRGWDHERAISEPIHPNGPKS